MSDYFTEIEAHFALRRGTPFVVSPKDWALMQSWLKEGVPLPVVIEAIDSVFAKNEASGRKKVISSLSYCRHAVKELWHERRELTVGEGEGSPEESPAEPLGRLANDLESSTSAVVKGFAARVRGLVSEKSVPRIEESLIAIEHELIEEVLATMGEEERAAFRLDAVTVLGDTSRLDEKTRARTEEANLRRLVRERFELPRLTLFR